MLKQLNLSRLWLALGLLFFSFAVGVGGFMLLENYPLVDAFYMTVITASFRHFPVAFHNNPGPS